MSFYLIRFEPLFDTLRGSSRDLYFTPAQRSRLVYDCLLRTPFDTTVETESEEQQGKKIRIKSKECHFIFVCFSF